MYINFIAWLFCEPYEGHHWMGRDDLCPLIPLRYSTLISINVSINQIFVSIGYSGNKANEKVPAFSQPLVTQNNDNYRGYLLGSQLTNVEDLYCGTKLQNVI